MADGVSKIQFQHYLLTVLWPPMAMFFTGKPGTGVLMTIVLIVIVPLTFGIALIGWLGMVPYGFRRLRAWERGVDLLE